jgi:hypothetical protein
MPLGHNKEKGKYAVVQDVKQGNDIISYCHG